MNYLVKAIYIYPIKSLGGIQLSHAYAATRGFEYDRRWMLVDESGVFLTQRECKEMALFKCSFEADKLVVKFKNQRIVIPLEENGNKIRDVEVFDSKFKASVLDDSFNVWFSQMLNRKVQLVKMTDISDRIKAFKIPPFKTKVSLADGYPYLILGEKSMNELNERMEEKLNIDRFRPNIIVSTDVAHEEDAWNNFKLGDAELKIIKPCARCIIPTIDQKSAEQGKEPLKTLATYRKKDNQIFFGANAIVTVQGKISVGNEINFIQTDNE